eukprot:TRINITY_DN6901_c0_g1_i1.p1 TRINITY_DN6901_c0_g1~~TRINITY_DN6901_c0_g1_i1.p1  ORF type:complete len:874 (+),score=275.10 TRINITY_DN6901_c0_g1_i1:129-2750(+)
MRVHPLRPPGTRPLRLPLLRLPLLLLVFVFLLALSPPCVRARPKPAELSWVDPFIGTNGHGYGFASLYPGPQVPFGVTRVSPDTSLRADIVVPWTHNGGYWYPDNHIRCFSHTRLVGAGVRDLGNLGVMAGTHEPSARHIKDRSFGMVFAHEYEEAWPGYYSVELGERAPSSSRAKPSPSAAAAPGSVSSSRPPQPFSPARDLEADGSIRRSSLFRSVVLAELSASAHTAAHRYTFTDRDDGYVMFDLFHSLSGLPTSVQAANISVDPAGGQLSGWLYNSGDFTSRVGGVNLFFVASFNASFSAFATWGDDAVAQPNQTFASGNASHCGGWFLFPHAQGSSEHAIELFVSTSWISMAQAQANHQQVVGPSARQATHRPMGGAALATSFDAIATAAEDAWKSAFGNIHVGGGTSANLTVFYTALYHAYQAPTQYAESGGMYLGFDSAVHKIPQDSSGYYSDMSIWDTHRTQFPWLAFAQPQIMQDIARSLVLMFEQGGDLPRWPLANGYTGSMIGTHADIILSDAACKGLDFNLSSAYAGMYQGATQPQAHAGREDLDDYTTIGYVAYEADEKGCPNTLAYAFDDWAVANMAAIVGRGDDFSMFRARSGNWRTQLEPSSLFMCPRTRAGEWECPPIWTDIFDKRYVEGDAWHYRFNVPHDGFALVSAWNSTQQFVDALEEFFDNSLGYRFGNFLPNPYYWAGNEEDLHAAYMFHWARKPSLSQKWVRTLLGTKYTTDPLGIPGNDDYGTLSAWALWGFAGLYPLAGNNTYMVGAPVFDNFTITITHAVGGNGPQPMRSVADDGTVKETPHSSPNTVLSVIAHNAQDLDNVYVQKATLGGVPLRTPFVTLEQMLSGSECVIEVWLGPQPSTWGEV